LKSWFTIRQAAEKLLFRIRAVSYQGIASAMP
jgi:hypothetical protein